MRLTRIERIVYRALLRASDGLEFASLCWRYRLLPGEVAAFAEMGREREWIKIEGRRIRLTAQGEWELTKCSPSLRRSDRESRRFVPEEFVREPIALDEPYIPNWMDVDDEVLPTEYVELKAEIREKLENKDDRAGGQARL